MTYIEQKRRLEEAQDACVGVGVGGGVGVWGPVTLFPNQRAFVSGLGPNESLYCWLIDEEGKVCGSHCQWRVVGVANPSCALRT